MGLTRNRRKREPEIVIARDTDSESSASEEEEEEEEDYPLSESEKEDEEVKIELDKSKAKGKAPITVKLKKVCKVCKQPGHEAGFKGATYIDCPMKPCFLCKMPGHTTMSCPHRVVTDQGILPTSHRNTKNPIDFVFMRQLQPRIPPIKPPYVIPDQVHCAVIRYHSRRVTCLEFHPTRNNILLSGDKKGQIGVWDFAKVYEKSVYGDIHSVQVNNMRFSPTNDDMVYSASSDGKVGYTDLETGTSSTLLNLNPNGWQGPTTWNMLYGLDINSVNPLLHHHHHHHHHKPKTNSHFLSLMETPTMKPDTVLILDFGSQYTHLITRRIRSLNVFSLVLSGTSSLTQISSHNPRVVILSGGPHSVHAPDAPSFPDGFVEWAEGNGVHVLGICYGLQLIVQRLGGVVVEGESKEYGKMEIEVKRESEVFGKGRVGEKQVVWMSHGDEAVKLPHGFEVVAQSAQGAVAALENRERRIYGLQYHPEVTHSPKGMETLKHFLFDVCGVSADWKMEDLMEEEIKVINKTVAADEHVICALSGGVDSTVAATLVHKAIGDRLHCIFVDNGLLRYKEQERVMDTFERDLHLPVTCVDASEQFLSQLKGVVDPETKRKIIGKEFINIFDEFAKELEKKHGKKPAFLVQGTLYPDVIESCPPPGTDRTHSHTIKSHHNVGGLPKDMKLKLIEPLKLLFKDEVRELGRILNVPVGFLKRHPFPGPGLAVRVLGDVTQGNALEVLRQVDEIFIQSIRDAGLYDSIWQAFAVFLPVRSVGVQGDKRTHSHVVALRAVTSQDGMTADWFNFEHKFLDDVSRKICNSVQGVNRVVQDITSKPPSTIEWE